MIPRTSSGRGFKGAAAYYLHDKGRDTADRVRFTQTLNLANDAPRRAVAEMIYTAEHAGDLKASAGVKSTGRKLDKPVYTFSLSWHPSEKPTDDQMRDAAGDALKALKMRDHQVLMIAHNDTEHPHIHLMVNRVHPKTGIAHPLSKDHMILSKWAEKYEKEHGKTWCAERVKNNAERHQASFAKARGQAATAFVKDRKSQERDVRPEYDRRQAGIRAKAMARQAQTCNDVSPDDVKQRAKSLVNRLTNTPESQQHQPSIPPHGNQSSPVGSISPQILNRLQKRHQEERNELLIGYEKQFAEAKQRIEQAYGPEKRQCERRLAAIKLREIRGSWLSKSIDFMTRMSARKDSLEKKILSINARSDEIFRPIETRKRAAIAVLNERQDVEKRELTPAPHRNFEPLQDKEPNVPTSPYRPFDRNFK